MLFRSRSMPISEPWPLRMARIATRSIHHCGKRTPRRMRQSGNALRKLIRSVAAPGFWRVEGKAARRDPARKPLPQAARQGYWDRLLMSPGIHRPADTHRFDAGQAHPGGQAAGRLFSSDRHPAHGSIWLIIDDLRGEGPTKAAQIP